MTSNDLGDFLRAHRARLRPDDVGLASYGARRVAGLRREEVAVLAGMNSDYYARLEQGRERSPSAQILEAISGALLMDDAAREHLFRLAGTAPEGERPQPREAVSTALRQLLDGHASAAAFVLNPANDFLASNALADALFSPFETVDNMARMTFLDPAARSFFAQWERAAKAVVAGLRHATGLDPHYARLHELVASLAEESEEFAALWSSHTVHGKSRDGKELLHPDVGLLDLTYQTFDVRGAPGQQLVIYHAEAGSPSAQALALLGSLHATRSRESASEQ
ncbi:MULTISPECIES: helix-turn-helix transcriptional regulator [unclassified Streptomyces]|uniref:helix-turn-helix transcriptional regulator n=1 Tax=unclassified Streptomyces TaxID=2593676 RepID=UPI00093AAFCF|nr:helix-turn-helix transcriptional regulator [Streptomyces sp. CB02058]OKI86536.1 XRE family transcriptional regulator [Streptomyces sp. CB02058]